MQPLRRPGEKSSITDGLQSPASLEEPKTVDPANYGLKTVESHLLKSHELGLKMVADAIGSNGGKGVFGVRKGKAEFSTKDGRLVNVEIAPEGDRFFISSDPGGGVMSEVKPRMERMRRLARMDLRPAQMLGLLQDPAARLIGFEVEPVYDNATRCLAYGWRMAGPPGEEPKPHAVIHYGPEGVDWRPKSVQNDRPDAMAGLRVAFNPVLVSYVYSGGEVQRMLTNPSGETVSSALGKSTLQLIN